MTWQQFGSQYLIPLITLLSVAVPLLAAYFKFLTNKLQAKDAEQQKTIDASKEAIVDLHTTVEQHADAMVTPEMPARPDPLPQAITK